jgi:hypothetical protein
MWKARRRAALAAVAAVLAVFSAPSAASAAGVLVVGDSLAELSSPYLDDLLGPEVELTINAVGGSNSYEILDLFEESYDPSQSVIVFDAGTNDNPNYPSIMEENLAAVANQVGDRCIVVPTVHGFTVEGTDNHGKNAVIHNFAASRPGTQVPDWATIANTRADLMQSDGLHPTEEGAQYRAQLIAEGIRGCLETAATRLPAPIEGSTPAELEAEGASPAAAAAADTVEPVVLEPVGRMAARQRLVLRDLSRWALPRIAAAGLMRAVLAR